MVTRAGISLARLAACVWAVCVGVCGVLLIERAPVAHGARVCNCVRACALFNYLGRGVVSYSQCERDQVRGGAC